MKYKFRGKRIDNGEWVYGSLLRNAVGECYIFPEKSHTYKSGKDEIVLMSPAPEVHRDSVGMWAGKLCDGVELYQNDICVANWPYADMCTVIWDEKRCGFYMTATKPKSSKTASYDKYYKLNANKMTIVGNTTDNPELLE